MRSILLLLILFSSCSLLQQSQEDEVVQKPSQPVVINKTFDFLSSRPIHELILGWSEMLEIIEGHIKNTEDLLGKEFDLSLKLDGKWSMDIKPSSAFDISEKGSGDYRLKIIRPELLFQNTGGIKKMVFVGASLTRVGGKSGKIDLTGNIECVYPVTFYQTNGDYVDFDKLKDSYHIDFLISNPSALRLETLTQNTALFKRELGSSEEVTLKIHLTELSTGNKYIGKEVVVPICTPKRKQIAGAKYLMIKPEHCVRHLQTFGTKYTKKIGKKVNSAELYRNICEVNVRCNMPARYGYIKDKKVVFMERNVYKFAIKAYSDQRVDTSWTFNAFVGDYDSTLYDAMTDSAAFVKTKRKGISNLTCQWN